MERIILASGSPRRRDLLNQIGLKFEVCSYDAEEIGGDDAPPGEMCKINAIRKAEEAARHTAVSGYAVIIAADTVVAVDGQVFGKPACARDAEAMLAQLSGRDHEVFTGVCILRMGMSREIINRVTFAESAVVSMRDIGSKEIADYVRTSEPMDKAGAYAIQGRGAVFVERINGDYNAVVGLPLARLYSELRRMGVLVPNS